MNDFRRTQLKMCNICSWTQKGDEIGNRKRGDPWAHDAEEAKYYEDNSGGEGKKGNEEKRRTICR